MNPTSIDKANQAVDAYIAATPEPKASELFAIIEQHLKLPDPKKEIRP